MIEVHKLIKVFGGLIAVNDLDMHVSREEIFGLIGPNGAGKSTVLNLLGGTLLPTRGKIFFKEEDITSFPSHRRAQRGIARVFQENILFNSFTVFENVIAGLHLQSRIGLGDIFVTTYSHRKQGSMLREKAFQTLLFVGLAQHSHELAINLPHGKQRLLALAIALATGPQVLLLDEPVTGMNAEEIENMLAMIRSLREKKGITCILIEHNLKVVMGLCDRIAVLNFGKKIAEGTPGEIVENPVVMEAYLGTEEDVT